MTVKAMCLHIKVAELNTLDYQKLQSAEKWMLFQLICHYFMPEAVYFIIMEMNLRESLMNIHKRNITIFARDGPIFLLGVCARVVDERIILFLLEQNALDDPRRLVEESLEVVGLEDRLHLRLLKLSHCSKKKRAISQKMNSTH